MLLWAGALVNSKNSNSNSNGDEGVFQSRRFPSWALWAFCSSRVLVFETKKEIPRGFLASSNSNLGLRDEREKVLFLVFVITGSRVVVTTVIFEVEKRRRLAGHVEQGLMTERLRYEKRVQWPCQVKETRRRSLCRSLGFLFTRRPCGKVGLCLAALVVSLPGHC